MYNIIFTIVAKNYLPLAHALGWSLKNNNQTKYKYIIIVADDTVDRSDNIFQPDQEYISVYDLELDNIEDIAFKYTVTEFCTAIKPISFQYLMKSYQDVDNFIYFDPDIFVFNNISNITDNFADRDIIVTPHYITPEIEYTGDQIDRSTLFVGIYNFGFVGIKRTKYTINILNWWHNRLMNQCYADVQDALHTDQKWMDFLSAFDNDKLHVSHNLGFNLAPWNLFERKIYKENNFLMVEGKFNQKKYPLTFVHFAGYDPKHQNVIHKDFFKMSIDKYPYYDLAREIYYKITSSYNFAEYKNHSYKFGNFSDGSPIQYYHRRLYRAITEDGNILDRPFSSEGIFFTNLRKAKMISNALPPKLTSKNTEELSGKMNKIDKVFKLIFKLLGPNKYFTLLKYFNRYSRPENQTFLLGKSIKKFY